MLSLSAAAHGRRGGATRRMADVHIAMCGSQFPLRNSMQHVAALTNDRSRQHGHGEIGAACGRVAIGLGVCDGDAAIGGRKDSVGNRGARAHEREQEESLAGHRGCNCRSNCDRKMEAALYRCECCGHYRCPKDKEHQLRTSKIDAALRLTLRVAAATEDADASHDTR